MRNDKEQKWSWNEYKSDVYRFAKACHALGLSERKAVNIMGANAPEWMIGYWGAMFHNMIASGIYITNEPDAC